MGVNSDETTNGGVIVDYVYSYDDFQLGNNNDQIILENGNGILDTVEYTDADFPDDKGYSLSLNPNNLNASDNDDGANWCGAISALSGGDFGTPSAENDPCR